MAQCKYDLNEVDPITEKRLFRTQAVKFTSGAKMKDAVSIGFVMVQFARSTKGNTIKLDGNVKNPQGRALVFMLPGDSLQIKFSDKTLISLPAIGMPIQYMNSFNGKRMIAFEYGMSDQLMEKFRTGGVVQFMRITNRGQNWDFSEFALDMGEIFRNCWLE